MKRVHDGKKPKWESIPVSCSICNITFKNSVVLNKHKNKEHSDDRNLSCKYCGKRFGNPSAVRFHEACHEEPRFKCIYCGKMFKSKSSQREHERDHTGERPWSCALCGKGFKSSSTLGQHRKYVHKIVSNHPMAKPLKKRVRIPKKR